MTATAAELVEGAQRAAARGAYGEASDLLGRALAVEDLPQAHELLGVLAYAEDDMDVVGREWEAAFRGYRDQHRPCDAARVAAQLCEVHWDVLGNPAIGRGWLGRARRLLDEVGPCVEWGYLELALIACNRPDAEELQASAERARRIAVEHGDMGLEVRALADGGLALVSQGRIAEGFRQLDEAFVALAEVDDPFIVGTTLCALLSSCDRAGDVERAAELVRFTQELVLEPNGGRPRILGTHCHVAYGGVLCTAGRWPEAEKVIALALGPGASKSVLHRADAAARLAEIRLHQGRIDEAAEVLSPYEDHVVAGGALALVHAARDDHALARAVLRRTVAQLVGDVVRGAPLLALLVECELAVDDPVAAADAARLLDAMAGVVDLGWVEALALQAQGRLALAAGDPGGAAAALSGALERLATAGRPLLDVGVHLDLARAHAAAGDRAAAVDAARAAHAVAVRVGAQALRDRSGAVLRDLGATAPRSAPASRSLAGLTARELEVLDGVTRGETNADIVARLYLSAKTVEHHVSRVLAKLGVRSRAEAAAVATAATLGGSGGE